MSAAPMRTGVAALLVALCALAMLGLVLLYAFAPDLRSDSSSGADALSRSAIGFEGLKDLLGFSGIPVAIARTAPGNAAVRPSLTMSPSPVRTVAERPGAGKTIIFAPCRSPRGRYVCLQTCSRRANFLPLPHA